LPHYRRLRQVHPHQKRREIERALTVLEDAGRLRRKIRSAERGRPAEIGIAVLADAA
jgi:hypothetical protein